MSDSEDQAARSDPMGVRRRWGRRELILLVCAALVVIVVALLARDRLIGRPPHGAPLGYIPVGQPNRVGPAS